MAWTEGFRPQAILILILIIMILILVLIKL